jgi:hypothetical protein
MSVNRLRQRTFNGPAKGQSAAQSDLAHIHLPSPVRHDHRLSVERESSRCTCVFRLFPWRSPSTVAKSVRAIIVDAVKRAISWACPHVAEKVAKVASPFVRHRDPSSSVVLEIGGCPTITSSPRSEPGIMRSRSSLPVCDESRRVRFALQTPATLGESLSEIEPRHQRPTPAVAHAMPVASVSFGNEYRLSLDKQAAKASPDHFDWWLHAADYNTTVCEV